MTMTKRALPFAIIVGVLLCGAEESRACQDHDKFPGRRGPRPRRSDLGGRGPTDEASAASSTDVTYQCTAYSYAPLTAIQNSYPVQWTTATIQPNDTDATSLFGSINATLNSKFPTDLPRGTPAGDFSGVSYSSTDPDCWWTSTLCTTPNASTGLPADITNVPEPMTWGLGFDDGPNCSHNALYDYLLQENLKATMFYIGSNIFDWPLQALRAASDGHQICLHTWSHQYMTALSNEQAFAELYYTRKAVHDLLGVTPQCWRPPYGDVDNRIRTIAQALNLTTIIWSHDTKDDWEANTNGVTPAMIDANYQGIIDMALNGSFNTFGPVVLNHELDNYTMGEFMKYAPAIKSAFKQVVPIATAFNISQPYAESSVTFPTFSQVVSGSSTTPNVAVNVTQGQGAAAAVSAPAGSVTPSKAIRGVGNGGDNGGDGASLAVAAVVL
ncbi:hypothetical protein EHS25_002132 [Saitozyma podzolica]|uniref:chitin deacetylase n=1 Tax=Saitozyma podzolica TaxID=1890683 RepID=A0A427YEJ4_9TREE|nr:hypothetical protein EHS25_002132 [Saitozyma podzolica]